MTSRSGSTDFSRLFHGSSKELYSEKFYYAMDTDSSDLEKYDHQCNNIDVKRPKEQVILICKKYLRFLDTCKEENNLFFGFDVSLLLSYWLYDKLTHIYPNAKNYEINIAFSALQGIWDKFDSNRRKKSSYIKCKPKLSMVENKDWKNRKKLYDYYIDSNHLVSLAKTFDYNCEYYQKIKEIISLYEYFEGECTAEKNNCPDFYNLCKSLNPKHELSTMKCYKQIPEENALESADSAKGDSLPNTIRGSQFRADGSGSGLQGDAFITQDTHSTLQTSGIGTKVTHSVLGAAPVLFTATALYRFTPLGPWIRKLRTGKTNSMNAMDTFSPYAQETGDMFSHDSENYISYQPM